MPLCPASVLVTGSNRGVGLEFVKQFLALESKPLVFAACRSPKNAKDLQDLQTANKTLYIVELDVSNEKTIEGAKNEVEKIVGDKGLALLVNNAGIASSSPAEDKLHSVTSEKMLNLFRTNTVGPLMVTKAFLPLLEKAAKASEGLSINKSAIINISTGVASITDADSGGAYAYRTSKAGLNMITKNLSVDLKPSGILVTAIHPGWVQTDMGGPKAMEPASTCVGRMMKVMATLEGEKQTGMFYHNKGHVIPW